MEKDLSRIMNEEYRRYYDRCVMFAKSYVYDINEAKTIASDALLDFWDKTVCKGESVDRPVPFLFCLVRNKALDSMRAKYAKKRSNVLVFPGELEDIDFRIKSLEACDPHMLYSADVQKIITDTLNSFGEKTREIFELSRYEGFSNKKIAEMMGLGVKAVEYHITLSLKAFREALKEYLPIVAVFLSL